MMVLKPYWNTVKRAIATVIVFAVLIIYLFPLYWMGLTSLESVSTILRFPPKLVPTIAHWSNYLHALTALPFDRYFANTFEIAIFEVVGAVFSSALFGFAFARLRARGKNVLFLLVLGGLMLPYTVVMIPQYLLFRDLGWINTYLPLIVPGYFGLPFLIFLFRQFYSSIPQELYDAAMVDGCGYLGLFWRVTIPLSKPVLIAAAIFNLTAVWNDFLPQLIYINSSSKDTVALGLASFTASYGSSPWNLLMAASLTVAMVPILAFVFGQNQLLNGIVVTMK